MIPDDADVRGCERDGDFGARFIELARTVYQANDRRAVPKRRLGAESAEETSLSAVAAEKVLWPVRNASDPNIIA